MTDNLDADQEFFLLCEGTFDGSVVLPPTSFPQGNITLLEALRRFCAEREEGRVDFQVEEMDALGSPLLTALQRGWLRATCVTLEGPHLRVDPVAFNDRQTWLAIFDKAVTLPFRPRVGIEPGFLIVDKSDFERNLVGFRAEKGWKGQGATYTPPILKFAIRAVHQLGIEGGNFGGENLVKAVGDLARKEGLVIGDRALNYLIDFMIEPKHFKNGWTSSIPPVFEFMLEMIDHYPFDETWKFDRPDFKEEILKYSKARADLGISPTHAGYLSTFSGNPEHSSGGPTPSRPGARQTKPSKVRRPE